MAEQNDSPGFQEAYEAAIGAFETAAVPEFFFENVSAKELVKANELDADEETAQEALDALRRELSGRVYDRIKAKEGAA